MFCTVYDVRNHLFFFMREEPFPLSHGILSTPDRTRTDTLLFQILRSKRSVSTFHHRSIFSRPDEIRTHTLQGLSLFPLPIGVRVCVICTSEEIRTLTNMILSHMPLPVGLQKCFDLWVGVEPASLLYQSSVMTIIRPQNNKNGGKY